MNLKQIKKYLKGWFENHPFINTVVVSTKDDFVEIRNVNYPVAHIEYINNNTTSTYNNYIFSISIADIQNNKLHHRGVDDIHNATNLIAQDFIDFHSEIFEDFEIDENISIQPFEESNPDRTAGVIFAIRISVIRVKNTCIIPK